MTEARKQLPRSLTPYLERELTPRTFRRHFDQKDYPTLIGQTTT